MSTASTDGARSHARAQAELAEMRIPQAPEGVDPSALLWAESIPAGSYTSRVLGRGTKLRLSDPDGGACAHTLLFRADAPWERLNVADSMKVPWQAYLSAGHPLLSDQGRVLATVVTDSSARHDMLCGMTPEGQDAMLLAGLKHGLDIRDIGLSASFFKGVRVDSVGALDFTGTSGPGGAVELLIHLPVVITLTNTAHPLDPNPALTALDVVAWRADAELTHPVTAEPEYLRALFNTESTWALGQSSQNSQTSSAVQER